jgi:hypothetical protein
MTYMIHRYKQTCYNYRSWHIWYTETIQITHNYDNKNLKSDQMGAEQDTLQM